MTVSSTNLQLEEADLMPTLPDFYFGLIRILSVHMAGEGIIKDGTYPDNFIKAIITVTSEGN